MYLWKVTIEAWPFSTFDQSLAGERSRNYVVRAVDIGDALKAAEHIATGIRSNPAVWRAPITSIIKEGE